MKRNNIANHESALVCIIKLALFSSSLTTFLSGSVFPLCFHSTSGSSQLGPLPQVQAGALARFWWDGWCFTDQRVLYPRLLRATAEVVFTYISVLWATAEVVLTRL
eukprot:3048213-Rhodomonas_salina.1